MVTMQPENNCQLIFLSKVDIPTMSLPYSGFYKQMIVCFTILTVCVLCSAPMARADESEPPTKTDRVLRHAVFFSFKSTSSESEVAGVAKAFESLPSKIEAISKFQWGINGDPGQQSGGFTHAFLLSFDDEAGRTEYLPHPAHKAFGDVLRPHMRDVFVIDYWGDPDGEKKLAALPQVIKHAVFLKFKSDATADEIHSVESALSTLPEQIDEIKHFEWGKNNSPERHDDGFTHCLMMTFADHAGLEAYLPHPVHQEFVKLLRPKLDEVRVIDFVVK